MQGVQRGVQFKSVVLTWHAYDLDEKHDSKAINVQNTERCWQRLPYIIAF